MPDPSILRSRDAELFFPVFNRLDVVIERGEGPYLYASDGRLFLDFFGGLAVNALGHAHPAIRAAINDQAARYSHLSNLFVQEPQVNLAARLTALTGMPRVFFCNSGTEAIEAAVKLVRKWGAPRNRNAMVGFSGGFHGRTMSALSLMEQEKYREGYGPFLEGCQVLPFNDVDALRSNVSETTAAVFIEFLQGEGGVIPATANFVEVLEDLRRRYGFLLVADEVQCGTGRTGRFSAFEHWNVRPDVMVMAKAIGGGLPLGAILTTHDLSEIYGKAGHGTTFGGNPISCAAGVACIDVMLREQLVANAAWIGSELIEGLETLQREFPGTIKEIRGAGCMIGMELYGPADAYAVACRERGLLVNVTQGNVVRLLPPYVLEACHVQEGLRIMREAMEKLAAQHADISSSPDTLSSPEDPVASKEPARS